MVLLWFAVAWVLATLSFQLACPLHYTPLGEQGCWPQCIDRSRGVVLASAYCKARCVCPCCRMHSGVPRLQPHA